MILRSAGAGGTRPAGGRAGDEASVREKVAAMSQDTVRTYGPTQPPRPLWSGRPKPRGQARALLARLQWFGTACGITGAVIVAFESAVSGYGFVFLAVSAVSWTAAAMLMGERQLIVLQGAFIAINLVGIYTWLLA